jgi:ribosomal protein L11 methyltransferase
MTWWAIEVEAASDRRDLVGQRLAALTGQAVVERPEGVLVGYQSDRDAADRVAADLHQGFEGLAVIVRSVEPVDWTERWKDGLAVREVGRLAIGPSWLLEPGPGRVVVDPEMAFGTGEHGSTRGALTLLARHLPPDAAVLDLGSGSGILTIAAIKLGARHAIGIEVDPDAVPVAEANAGRNGVGARVRFLLGDAGILAPVAGPVGLVVSNILRNANVALLDPIGRALGAGGVAIFAGMEADEAPLFRPRLEEAGFEPIDELVDAGWWSVAARVR